MKCISCHSLGLAISIMLHSSVVFAFIYTLEFNSDDTVDENIIGGPKINKEVLS